MGVRHDCLQRWRSYENEGSGRQHSPQSMKTIENQSFWGSATFIASWRAERLLRHDVSQKSYKIQDDSLKRDQMEAAVRALLLASLLGGRGLLSSCRRSLLGGALLASGLLGGSLSLLIFGLGSFIDLVFLSRGSGGGGLLSLLGSGLLHQREGKEGQDVSIEGVQASKSNRCVFGALRRNDPLFSRRYVAQLLHPLAE